MSVNEIQSKSIVVAIWDEDSKSHDDFMPGVSFIIIYFCVDEFFLQITMSLKDVLFFREKRVNIDLMHQDSSGHVMFFVFM